MNFFHKPRLIRAAAALAMKGPNFIGAVIRYLKGAFANNDPVASEQEPS